MAPGAQPVGLAGIRFSRGRPSLHPPAHAPGYKSSVLRFSDEEAANAADPVLDQIEQPSRRSTLVARRGERAGKVVYSFTIDLQGPGETVFFDA